MVLGDSLAHDTMCAGVGNWPMSSPTSAMMTWAAWWPIPATSSKRSTTGRRGQQLAGFGVDAVAVGVTRHGLRRLNPSVEGCCGIAAGAGCWCWGLRGRDCGDRLLDPGGELVDLAAQGVDLVQQHPRQLCMMVVEAAGEGLHQRGVLDPEPSSGQ